jgi:hypothetical protein
MIRLKVNHKFNDEQLVHDFSLLTDFVKFTRFLNDEPRKADYPINELQTPYQPLNNYYCRIFGQRARFIGYYRTLSSCRVYNIIFALVFFFSSPDDYLLYGIENHCSSRLA